MSLDDQLTEIFDRAMRQGVNSLSPTEYELLLIQDFFIEYEMSGLSGYFYNRLPDLGAIKSAIAAMRQHGFLALAQLLSEAADLFDSYEEPHTPTTWSQVLQQYDPNGRMSQISDQIRTLRGNGAP
jgi:hypothetical protein